MYATCVANETGEAATLYWARSRFFGSPLILLDWEVAQLTHETWMRAHAALRSLSLSRRARHGSVGIYVEDEGLVTHAEMRGARATAIYKHLTTPDRWLNLCLSAMQFVKGGMVDRTKAVTNRADERTAGFLNLTAAPRGEDPTVAAFVYGITLGLDPNASVPPRPAVVKVAT